MVLQYIAAAHIGTVLTHQQETVQAPLSYMHNDEM